MKTTYQSQNPADTRKSLQVVQSLMTDDSMRLWYEPQENEENRILVQHYNPENPDDIVNQIQCDKSGVYHHVRENGSWRAVPHAIGVGGTGATNRKDAAANLSLEFRAGDTLSRNGMLLFGYVTENTTRLIFEVPLGRQSYGLSNVTFTSFHGVLRGVNGYLDNNNTDRNLLASPFTNFAVQYPFSGTLRVIVTKNAAFTNVVNNTPIACMISYACTLN